MKTIVTVAVAVALSGCAIKYVDDSGKLASEREVTECEYEADKATASRGGTNPLGPSLGGVFALQQTASASTDRQSLVATCMKLKGGYKPTM